LRKYFTVDEKSTGIKVERKPARRCCLLCTVGIQI